MSDDALTSSWCTNWAAYNTPRLWSMVKDEDDPLARSQVGAWRQLAGSVRSEKDALVAARADLVAVWPPEENASAAAFVGQLDNLIARLDTASADAETTANGLDNVLNALAGAKERIRPLWEQYKDKSSDVVPRWFDSAEDEIDDQARRHMMDAERAVSDAVAMLKVPAAFEFRIEGVKEWPPPPPAGEGTARLGPGGGIDVLVPHDPVPPLPGADPTVHDISGIGGAGAVASGAGAGAGGAGGDAGVGGAGLGGAGLGGAGVGGAGAGAGVGGAGAGAGVGGAGAGVGGAGAGAGIGGAGIGAGGGAGIGAGAVIGGGAAAGGPDLAGVINPPGLGGEAGAVPGGGTQLPAGGGQLPGGGTQLPGGVTQVPSAGVGGVPPIVPGVLPGAGGGQIIGGGPGRPSVSTSVGAGSRRVPLPSGAVIGEIGAGGGGVGPQLAGAGGRGAVGGAGGVPVAGGRRGRSDRRSSSGAGEQFGGGGASGSAAADVSGGVGGVGVPIGGPVGARPPTTRTGVSGFGGGRISAGSGVAGSGVAGSGAGGGSAEGRSAGGTSVGGRGSGGGGSGGGRVPRPSWLPDDPVGPERHQAAAGGVRPDRRGWNSEEPARFEADNAWRVAEGVAPVIGPGEDDGRHDPGPNVIGRRG
ncbi:hypothetical protein ACQPZJ_47035 [Actinoplanes sp. CA-054009]